MSLAPYSVSLSAASGMWEYRPFRDALVIDGWNASYTGSTAWPKSGTTEDGAGSLYFRTQLSGAIVGLSFIGTRLHLCLTDYGARYLVFLDGSAVEPVTVADDPQCVSQGAATTVALTGLEFKSHTVTLSVQNPTAESEFWFYGGTIETNIDVSSTDDMVAEKVIDDLDPGWALTRKAGSLGGWDTAADEEFYLGSSSFTCLYGTGADSTATYNFTGASAVVLFGSSSLNNHAFSVVLDGETFNSDTSTSSWHIPEIVTFFRAGLDPDTSHTLTFRNWSDDNKQCPDVVDSGFCCQGLDHLKLVGSSAKLVPSSSTKPTTTTTTPLPSITTTSPSTPPEGDINSSMDIAAVVGGIVGGLVSTLLIAGIVLYICRRKKQRNTPQLIPSTAAANSSLTPYSIKLKSNSITSLRKESPGPIDHRAGHPGATAPPVRAAIYFAASSYARTATTDNSYESAVPLDIGLPTHPSKPQRSPGPLFPLGEPSASSSSGKASSSETRRMPEPAQGLESRQQDMIDLLVARLRQRDALSPTSGTLPPAYRQSPV